MALFGLVDALCLRSGKILGYGRCIWESGELLSINTRILLEALSTLPMAAFVVV